ncbi:hypothetical protein [Reichenbachiella versicolor]|uniref:hypothetical protein n=1 Tax=Reichenbachiella versicolor TaxID=1821036 RepID=UPI000D6DF393|nr:hypothetical protein [Reichenbachiella versicolor]
MNIKNRIQGIIDELVQLDLDINVQNNADVKKFSDIELEVCQRLRAQIEDLKALQTKIDMSMKIVKVLQNEADESS